MLHSCLCFPALYGHKNATIMAFSERPIHSVSPQQLSYKPLLSALVIFFCFSLPICHVLHSTPFSSQYRNLAYLAKALPLFPVAIS